MTDIEIKARGTLTSPKAIRLAAWIAGAALVFALVALLSAFLPPLARWTIPSRAISAEGGHLFSARIPTHKGLWTRPDSSPPIQSSAKLLENGHTIGPAHALHADIKVKGAGAYSHWGNSILFSTPDNSDPRTNGRRYTLVYQLAPAPAAQFMLWLIFGAAAAIDLLLGLRDTSYPSAIRRWGTKTADVLLAHDGALLLLSVFAVFAFLHPKNMLLDSDGGRDDIFRVLSIGVALAVGWSFTTASTGKAYTIFVRALGTALALYAFLVRVPIELVEPAQSGASRILLITACWAAPLFAVLGWRRPIFYLPVVFIVSWYRQEVSRSIGIGFNHGEELTLQESMLFLLMAGIALHWLRRIRAHDDSFWHIRFGAALIAACALHFANYYYSADAKIALDGGPFSWLLTNTTQSLLPVSDGIGTLPFGDWPNFTQSVYKLWRNHAVLVNATTLGLQLLSVPFIVTIQSARAALLLFDGMHLAIAGLSGIFFYLWMSLNVAFAVSLGFVHRRLAVGLRILCIGLLFSAPLGMTIFKAGWYDTPNYNRTTVWAITDKGQEARISPRAAYFLSYWFYSDFLLDPVWKAANALPTVFYGTAYTSEVRQRGCSVRAGTGEPLKLAPGVPNALRRLDRTLHAETSYELPYPHHFLQRSEPFAAVGQLSEQRIVGYRVQWEAVCVHDGPTGFTETVMRKADTLVPLQ